MLEMGGKNGQKCVPDHICISLLACPFCHLIAANLQNPGNNPPSRRENFPLTYMKKQGDYWINLMLHQQLTFLSTAREPIGEVVRRLQKILEYKNQ